MAARPAIQWSLDVTSYKNYKMATSFDISSWTISILICKTGKNDIFFEIMEKCALFFNYQCYSSSNFKSLCLFHLFYCSQYIRWQFFSYLQKLARRFAVVCPTRRAFSRLEGCITPPYPPGSFGPANPFYFNFCFKFAYFFCFLLPVRNPMIKLHSLHSLLNKNVSKYMK